MAIDRTPSEFGGDPGLIQPLPHDPLLVAREHAMLERQVNPSADIATGATDSVEAVLARHLAGTYGVTPVVKGPVVPLAPSVFKTSVVAESNGFRFVGVGNTDLRTARIKAARQPTMTDAMYGPEQELPISVSQLGGQLFEDFNDNIINTSLWPASFGTRSETGGRARVACAVGFSGIISARIYSMKESRIQARLFSPAAGGATVEAWSQMVVSTPSAGTDLIMEINAATGRLRMANRTDYADANAASIPYDPVAHAWLRIREAAGTTYWETSPDGITWTMRRSAVSPAWVSATTSRVELVAHRDAGVADFAEYDDLSMTQGAVTDLRIGSLAVGKWYFQIMMNGLQVSSVDSVTVV